MNRWKSRLINLSVVLVSLAIASIVAEVTLRIFLKDQITLFPRFHDSVEYGDFTIRRYHPNMSFWHTSIDGQWHFEINNRGFRDTDDYEYDKPAGVVRVLTLGDSHTSGYEVRQEHAYPELIESTLRSRGISAQSINSGISGFGTAEQLVFLENEGVKYQPDFVVVGFYANDFEDNVKSNLFRIENGDLIVAGNTHTPGIRVHRLIAKFGILRWLSQYSYAYSFSFNMAYELAKAALLSREVARAQTEVAIPTKAVDEYAETLTLSLLERMYRFCQVNGMKLIVVDIPRVSGQDQQIYSSIPEDLHSKLKHNSDSFLPSSLVFSSFSDDPTAIHVPHGHRHMSEPAHAAVAGAVSNVIENQLIEAR